MIIRKDPSGALTLIGQTDHSRFVGQLAAHWGSRDFEAPKPYDAVVRAATFHDYGWLRYETSPLIRPETGEPYSFLQVPMTAQQLGSVASAPGGQCLSMAPYVTLTGPNDGATASGGRSRCLSRAGKKRCRYIQPHGRHSS